MSLQVGKDNNLERSLFTRLQEVCTDVVHKPNMYSLRQQYRMHPEICHWSNKYFYENRLISASNTIDPTFKLNPYGVFSLDFRQSCNRGISFHNSEEAKFITALLKIIVRHADPKHNSYGIITPYSTQRKELQTHIKWARHQSSHISDSFTVCLFISPMQQNTWTICIPISSKYYRLIPRTRERYHHSVDYQNGWCRLS